LSGEHSRMQSIEFNGTRDYIELRDDQLFYWMTWDRVLSKREIHNLYHYGVIRPTLKMRIIRWLHLCAMRVKQLWS